MIGCRLRLSFSISVFGDRFSMPDLTSTRQEPHRPKPRQFRTLCGPGVKLNAGLDGLLPQVRPRGHFDLLLFVDENDLRHCANPRGVVKSMVDWRRRAGILGRRFASRVAERAANEGRAWRR